MIKLVDRDLETLFFALGAVVLLVWERLGQIGKTLLGSCLAAPVNASTFINDLVESYRKQEEKRSLYSSYKAASWMTDDKRS